MSEDGAGSGDRTLVLVRRSMEGDQDAIGELYRLYESRLEAAVHAKIGPGLRGRMEAVDLIQSVWKDVLPCIDDFEYRGPESFLRWLTARIIFKIQDKARYYGAAKRDPARERHLAGDSGSPGVPAPAALQPSPSQAAAHGEEADRLLRLLERIPPAQRQAIVRRIWDGMEFKEIGKIAGVSADTARKRYDLGMKKLQELLERECR